MTDRLSSLPPELILTIVTYLHTADQICLAMTSKLFSNIQGTGPWTALTKAKRAEGYKKSREKTEWSILERLERDFPDHHLCVWERKLRNHRRRPPPRQNQVHDPPRGWNRCRVRNPKTQITATVPANARTWMWPSFCEVRMIMSRHRFGASHGLPSTHLDLSTPWQANRSFRTYFNRSNPVIDAANIRSLVWYSKLDVNTVIMNNELQLHRSERCLIPATETDFLLKHRDEIIVDYNFEQVSPCLEMPGCIHQESALRKIRASNIIDLLRFASRGYENCYPRGYIDCLNCGSHVQFTVFNHDAGRAFEVVIDVWQDLGDGRYVDDGSGWTACYAHGNTVTKPLMEFTTQSMVDQALLQRANILFEEVNNSDQLSYSTLPRTRRANSMDNMRHGLAEDLLRRKIAYDAVWSQVSSISNAGVPMASITNGFVPMASRSDSSGPKDPSQLLDISRSEDDVGIYYMGVPHRRTSITGIATERILV